MQNHGYRNGTELTEPYTDRRACLLLIEVAYACDSLQQRLLLTDNHGRLSRIADTAVEEVPWRWHETRSLRKPSEKEKEKQLLGRPSGSSYSTHEISNRGVVSAIVSPSLLSLVPTSKSIKLLGW